MSQRNTNQNELDTLLGKLRPFQKEGFEFATSQKEGRNGRILLADEMVRSFSYRCIFYIFLHIERSIIFKSLLFHFFFMIGACLLVLIRDWGELLIYNSVITTCLHVVHECS
jgi:hypothetical protein